MQEKSEQRRPNHSQNANRRNNAEHGNRTDRKPAGERTQRRNNDHNSRPLPRIHTPYKDIVLTEEQKTQIDALNEKINALGKPVMPSREDFENKKEANDAEIKKLEARSQIIETQINDFEAKRAAIIEKSNPAKKAFQDKRNDLNETINVSKEIRARIDTLSKRLTELQKARKDQKSRFGFKTIEEAQDTIDSINYNIERQSLSNNQLKDRLSEIDRIKKAISDFQNVDSSEGKIAALKQEIDDLKAKREEINAKISLLKEELDKLHGEKGPRNTELDSISASIRELNNNRKEIRAEIKQRRDALQEVYAAYAETRDKYYKVSREVHDLMYERDSIYSAAERHMMQLEEAGKRATEIKTKVNPNADKISSARSLIAYLKNLIPVEAAPVAVKDMDEKTLAMLGNIKRKTPKAKKAKKPSQNLVHNIETVSKFSKLDLSAPKSVDQIPALIEKLEEMIKEFESSFIRAELRLNVQTDGKVKTDIVIL